MSRKLNSRSAASAADIRAEHALQKDVARWEELCRKAEASLAKFEARKEELLQGIAKGLYGATETLLSAETGKIMGCKRNISDYQEQIVKAKAKLEKFRQETKAKVPERTKQQNQLAALVAERASNCRAIAKLITSLRMLITDTGSLTTQIKKAAEPLQISAKWESESLALLSAALPKEFLAESEQWAAWFLGQKEGLQPYVVIADEVFLPETLADAGLHRFGDKVYLRADDAREMLRTDRLQQVGPGQYKLDGPELMTLEDFEMAQFSAEREGETISGYIANLRTRWRYEAVENHKASSQCTTREAVEIRERPLQPGLSANLSQLGERELLRRIGLKMPD